MVAEALLYITQAHSLVLCDQNIAELREVVQRKWPDKLADIDIFLNELPYELIPAVYQTTTIIRDETDQPILNAAILADVDIVLTGDKDFLSVGLPRPKCITVREFMIEEGLIEEAEGL